jgi:LemA protein
VVWVVIIIVAIVVILLLVLVGMYNKLVRLRNRAENAWAQVDVQLRKRYDLIPNLVETVKGYAAHERETFEAVTAARTAAQQAQGVEQQAQAENVLTAALGRLFAVAEAYPQLRATENFQQLQAQLSDVEQNIAVARQVYNDTVLSYDNALQSVPTNIMAGMFHFNPREYFQTEDATRAAPQVSFADATAAPPAAGPAAPELPAAPPEPEPPAAPPPPAQS